MLSSNTDAEREAETTQVNGKLYTIAKVQSDKSCPLVAGALGITMRGFIFASVLCGAMTSAAPAIEGNVESVDSLKDFTGIWAHSEDDCKKKMSGGLDAGDLDRVQTSSYELVGICDDGLDMLYQPVNCGASGIVKQHELIEFSAACRIKDYVADKRQRVLLKVEDSDHIQFADQEFMVFGKYVRCSRSYACEKSWNK
jgi:hypothetical protein